MTITTEDLDRLDALLTPQQKQAWLLRLRGFTLRESALALGVSVDAARRLHARARHRIQLDAQRQEDE